MEYLAFSPDIVGLNPTHSTLEMEARDCVKNFFRLL